MQTFISSCLQEKSYLLTTPKGYIVIDPGVGIFEQMKPYIKDMSTCVVLLTHVHFDHAFDACAFQKHGAKIAVHKLDEKNIFSKANLSFTMGLPFAKFVPDIFLQEGTIHIAVNPLQLYTRRVIPKAVVVFAYKTLGLQAIRCLKMVVVVEQISQAGMKKICNAV